MFDQYVKILDGSAHYVEYGRGSHTVLCLHGNSSSSDVFARFEDGLPPAFRLICLDFPGHGRSSSAQRYRGLCSFQGLARYVLELIKVLSITPVAIVGHGLGGHIASQLLPRIASLRALLLISSPPTAGAASLSRLFRKDAPTALLFARTLNDAQVDELSLASAHTNPYALARIAADVRRTDGVFRHELGQSLAATAVEDELAMIKSARGVRISLLGGVRDRFLERSYHDWVADQIGLDDREAVLLDGAGHYAHIEEPRATHAFFQRFLRRIDVHGAPAWQRANHAR